MTERFLVTGGTGFIGRFVVDELLRQGRKVRIFDLKPDAGRLDKIEPGMSRKVEFVTGDISDGSVVEAAAGCKGILHLAGVMTVDAAKDPVHAAQVNLIGSLHVFEAARHYGINRIAYVSSAAVFGFNSALNPLPMSHYGAQKLAVEGAARAYFLDHGLPSTGFRPYIVYGPGQSSGVAAGPSIALAAAHQGKPAVIGFSGRCGFVHVFDVARLMVASVLDPADGAQAYTLAGETADMEHFVHLLEQFRPDARIRIEGPSLRITSDLANSALPENLKAIGFTSLETGVQNTLDYYRQRDGARK